MDHAGSVFGDVGRRRLRNGGERGLDRAKQTIRFEAYNINIAQDEGAKEDTVNNKCCRASLVWQARPLSSTSERGSVPWDLGRIGTCWGSGRPCPPAPNSVRGSVACPSRSAAQAQKSIERQ